MSLCIVALTKVPKGTVIKIRTPLGDEDDFLVQHDYQIIRSSIMAHRAGTPVNEAFPYLTEEELYLVAHGERKMLIGQAVV